MRGEVWKVKQRDIDFGAYLYNSLPEIYRTADSGVYFTLRRFLDVLGEAGMKGVWKETLALADLIDVDKCPTKFLPQLSEMVGFTYSQDMPELLQRRLLKNIVEIYKRKGTASVIGFIARELTGFETEVIELQEKAFRTWSDNLHPEYASYQPGRLFSAMNSDLTYMYGETYRHKSFMVRLTGAYEQGTSEVEDAVVREVIQRFLGTHATAYILTVYYFLDDKNVSEETVENWLLEKLKTNDTELYVIGSQSMQNYDIMRLVELEESISKDRLIEVDRVLGNVKMAVEVYEEIVKTTEDDGITDITEQPLWNEFLGINTGILNIGRLFSGFEAGLSQIEVQEDREIISDYDERKVKLVDGLPDDRYLNRHRLVTDMWLNRKSGYDTVRINGNIVEIL